MNDNPKNTHTVNSKCGRCLFSGEVYALVSILFVFPDVNNIILRGLGVGVVCLAGRCTPLLTILYLVFQK